jgi:hypothetical protein
MSLWLPIISVHPGISPSSLSDAHPDSGQEATSQGQFVPDDLSP